MYIRLTVVSCVAKKSRTCDHYRELFMQIINFNFRMRNTS